MQKKKKKKTLEAYFLNLKSLLPICTHITGFGAFGRCRSFGWLRGRRASVGHVYVGHDGV